MKVWITKYALTRGIEEIDSENMKSFSVGGGYLSFFRPGGYCAEIYPESNCHYSKQSAVAKAEEMRQKKIENLKKQIEKLEEMRFE